MVLVKKMAEEKTQHVIPDVFHIGYQRTGTTWIQKGLLPAMRDKIFVPKSRQWKIYHANTQSDVTNIYQDIDINEVSGRVILETEEGLSGGRYRDHIEMAQKLSWVNPNAKILICIRSQKSIIPSLFYLYVRKGGVLNFSDYVRLLIENRKLDYWSLYSSYANIFPANKVKILVFEDLVRDPTTYVRDFCEFLGVSMSSKIPNQRFKNPRSHRVLTEYLRYLNILIGVNKVVRGLHNNRPLELESKLFKRNMLFKPVAAIFTKLDCFLPTSKYNILDFEDEFEEVYGQGNQNLFKLIDRDINATTYPGSS